MDQETLDKLPIPTASFPELRGAGQIYVDKTDLIYKLANGRNRIFLSRPRRFGKSLLVSTLESLFKNGVKEFEGLAIHQLWKDKTYQVVTLNFANAGEYSSFEDFQELFVLHLTKRFGEYGFKSTSTSLNGVISDLDAWLKKQEGSTLVLLIDEYDAPLTHSINDPVLFNKARSALSKFFTIVKDNDACWRLVFITGIAKFAKMSIFSAMNNLEDISLNPDYSALLGYTEEEIKRYFAPFIENAVSKVTEPKGLDRDGILSELKRHYDGFCFGADAKTQVYAPWSTLSFFKNPHLNFANYWFDSAGQPSMLHKYFKNHSFTDPSNYGKDKFISMSRLQLSSGAEDISELALMTHAGYLTIKNVTPGGIALGYPNDEVAAAIAQLYANTLLAEKTLLEVGVPDIKSILLKERSEKIVQTLNKIFAGINYNFYQREIVEEDVRAICQVLFKGAKMFPHIEHPNSEGRSDLELTVEDRHLVFEFKVQAPGRSAKTLLAQAVKQIKSRDYANDSFHPRITRIAMVFSRTKHKFVAWQEI